MDVKPASFCRSFNLRYEVSVTQSHGSCEPGRSKGHGVSQGNTDEYEEGDIPFVLLKVGAYPEPSANPSSRRHRDPFHVKWLASLGNTSGCLLSTAMREYAWEMEGRVIIERLIVCRHEQTNEKEEILHGPDQPRMRKSHSVVLPLEHQKGGAYLRRES
ncbi:hypothetical protein NMY22_g12010 [Coprinellus aureogranulatus]|nr:hypothetical protein NMY22_g12010 [Coprinellus aureogranulatus]